MQQLLNDVPITTRSLATKNQLTIMVRLSVKQKKFVCRKNNVLCNLQSTIALYTLQNISSYNYINNNNNYRV